MQAFFIILLIVLLILTNMFHWDRESALRKVYRDTTPVLKPDEAATLLEEDKKVFLDKNGTIE